MELQETSVSSPQSSMVSPDVELSLVSAFPLDNSGATPAFRSGILNEDSISNFHPVGLGPPVLAALTGLAKVTSDLIQSTLNSLLVLGFIRLACCRDSISKHFPKQNFGRRQS